MVNKSVTFHRDRKIELMASVLRDSPWKDPIVGEKWEITVPIKQSNGIDGSFFYNLPKVRIPSVSGLDVSYSFNPYGERTTAMTIGIYYRHGHINPEGLAKAIVNAKRLSDMIDYEELEIAIYRRHHLRF